MRIIKLLYLKYSLSSLICVISSFVIFFIFSLIGNLNEDYLFKTIINLSLLNAFQIIIYVPIFLFLISVVLLSIFLRSKNEIIIIKSYINTKKLMIFFFPVILIFTTLEMNKENLATIIENLKNDLVIQKNISKTKILINENNNSKNFIVFNNIDIENLNGTEYRFYKVYNNKIIEAEFSDDLTLTKEGLIANSYTKYNNEIIEDLDTKKFFKINFLDLINHNNIIKNISEKNNFFNIKSITLLIFSILLLNYIFLIFFNKKYVHIKQSLNVPIIISLVFLGYSFFIFNNSLSIYKQYFEALACVIAIMLIIKISINE